MNLVSLREGRRECARGWGGGITIVISRVV